MNIKITQNIAQEIIDKFYLGKDYLELCNEYKISISHIRKIISGDMWRKCKRDIQQREKGRYKKGRVCYIDVSPLTSLQNDIIIGSLLGDGCISNGKVNCSLSKSQSLKRKEYLEWHIKMLNPYSIETLDEIYSDEKLVGGKKGVILDRIKIKKRLTGYNVRTHQHPEFTELRKKWYPNGIKIVPKDIVLTPQSIAIWYFDDGSNCVKNRTAVLCTQCFTLDEADLLCQKLNKFNLMPKIIKVVSQYTGRDMPMLKFSKESYDNLIELVKPFCLWDCFKYKVEWRRALQQWEHGKGKISPNDVVKIRELRRNYSAKEIAKLYDIHVNTVFSIVSGRSRGAVNEIH